MKTYIATFTIDVIVNSDSHDDDELERLAYQELIKVKDELDYYSIEEFSEANE